MTQNSFHKETAYFASGCFWGTQYHLEKVKGVEYTHVGYMGGTVNNPSYPEVKTGTTGHVETVEVIFDPSQTSFEQLLRLYFETPVLVPLLVGLDPSTALFTAGLGTLIFHLVTKGKVPIFLGSSFAFVAPIIKATELYGLPGTMSGLVAVGAVYGLMSALVKWRGIGFIKTLFPPVVIGPVIILIGLSLAGSGVNMAKENWPLALIALLTAILASLLGFQKSTDLPKDRKDNTCHRSNTDNGRVCDLCQRDSASHFRIGRYRRSSDQAGSNTCQTIDPYLLRDHCRVYCRGSLWCD